MGRTGHLFACEAENIVPDIVTIAKGLGAGYQPIGAMLCQDFIFDAIGAGSGYFQHGHTYLGHPMACAAAGAVLTRLVDDGLVAGVTAKGAQLRSQLEAALGQHPHVGDIRGRGLFIGLELVADRGSKAPFDPSLALSARVKAAALQAGLICYPGQGTIDGVVGNHVLLAPPYIISDSEIEMLVTRLTQAIDSSCAMAAAC